MYLSRIPLDIQRRKTQIALVSPNKIHGAVENAFLEKQNRNLWRIDTLKNQTYLMILSSCKPDLEKIAQQFGYPDHSGESKAYEGLLNQIQQGSTWRFRLVANPTHSIPNAEGRGKVVAHTSKKYQLEWLEKQSQKNGFALLPESTGVRSSNWKIFQKQNAKQKVHILEVAFEGKLRVENVESFKSALINGIGREKAYGMGMLTIARSEG